MAIPRTRKAILTGAAALGVVLGAAGVTAAVTNSATSNASSAESPDQSDGPSYTSSITAPDGAAVDGLATITSVDAAAAAVSATNGVAGEVELENEHGNVVYGVEITQADGTKLDVKIDAGNGDVLAKESDGDTRGSDARDTKDTENANTDTADETDTTRTGQR